MAPEQAAIVVVGVAESLEDSAQSADVLTRHAADALTPRIVRIFNHRRIGLDQRFPRHCAMMRPFSQFVVLTNCCQRPTNGSEACSTSQPA